METTPSKTFNKKKRCAFLVSVKPEKLNNRMTRRHSGSYAIAWAAITISSYMGFSGSTLEEDVALKFHASWLWYSTNFKHGKFMKKTIVTLSLCAVALISLFYS